MQPSRETKERKGAEGGSEEQEWRKGHLDEQWKLLGTTYIQGSCLFNREVEARL